MRTLELDTTEHKFDSVEYNVNVGKKYSSRAVLRKDYEKRGDGILWLLASGVCLKAVYSEKDKATTARLNAEAPIENGEVVLVNGEQYKVRVLGDYSNCAILDKVA